ncbi:MAG: hypothetical protein AB8E15_05385 [Bdellovibrionales bacterium]
MISEYKYRIESLESEIELLASIIFDFENIGTKDLAKSKEIISRIENEIKKAKSKTKKKKSRKQA